ncbi:hypothetical protein ACFPFV_12535 [Salinicoccus siamensis]|uniref:hypothetical protein n=1 Tax=Salinicoccus siamensis TaxID=381830 RepID=UPI003615CD5D
METAGPSLQTRSAFRFRRTELTSCLDRYTRSRKPPDEDIHMATASPKTSPP